MPNVRRGERADNVGRAGMEGWDRDKDNRLRELKAKADARDATEAEEKELAELEEQNEQFIEAGLAYQRGAGLQTRDSLAVLAGYSMGLGNLWRFPPLAAKHGGLAFIVAYLLCTVFVARPLYLLELCFGQATQKSTVLCYRKLHRRWVGVGYAVVISLVLVLSYYSILLSYCSLYFVNSFQSPLPWTEEALGARKPPNITAAEFFWKEDVLQYQSSGLGSVNGLLVAGLFLAHLLVFLAIFKGIQVSAKITIITVTVPVFLLAISIIRTALLPGSGEGVKYYMRFDAMELISGGMWVDACTQSLFSLLFLPGTTITLASYMQEKEDIVRITNIVTAGNCIFSLLGGFAVFSILGHVEHTACEGCSMEEIASSSGGGLAFVALASGIATFDIGANAFAVVFYLMCFTLGLDTVFAGVETMVIYIEDYGVSIGRRYRHDYVTLACCAVLFLFGLVFTTQGGFPLLEVLDHYLMSYIMLAVCSLHCLMLFLDWGWDTLTDRIQLATVGLPKYPRGRVIGASWSICLKFITPLMCFGLGIVLLVDDCQHPYGPAKGEAYASGYQAVGWGSLIIVLLAIPCGSYYEIKREARALAREEAEREKERQRRQAGRLDGGGEPLLSDEEMGPVRPREKAKTQPVVRSPTTSPQDASPQLVTSTGKTAAMRRQLEAIGEAELGESRMIESISSMSETPKTRQSPT